MADAWRSILSSLYYLPESPAAFGGAHRLLKEAVKIDPGIKLKDVEDWLSEQDTYTLFRQAKTKFPRLKILVDDIDEQWQADLMDVSWFRKENDNTKYLLVAIDVLSRYAWVRPLEVKSGIAVSEAMESIFHLGRVPKKLQTDQGKEFLNPKFKQLMEKYGINHFVATDGDIKCAIAERLNRTLRSRIYRYLFANTTTRYLTALEQIVKGYNSSYHRTIKMPPESVSENNKIKVLQNIRDKKRTIKTSLAVGDKVRIQRKKGHFEKGATSTFNWELFKIAKKKKAPNTFVYKLIYLEGKPISSVFYPSELAKIGQSI